MTQEQNKRAAAEAALDFIDTGMVVGIGTGTTANYLIDALSSMKKKIDGAVASSDATAERLKQCHIRLLTLNDSGDLPLYIDGADEATQRLQLTKGGGGALTREKILAAASQRFVCIADQTKLVDALGGFPIPVEVIPMASSFLERELTKLGGRPVLRDGFTTDNGNLILDVHDFIIENPVSLEESINHLAGVVSNGIFARRPADVLLLGTDQGVEKTERSA